MKVLSAHDIKNLVGVFEHTKNYGDYGTQALLLS